MKNILDKIKEALSGVEEVNTNDSNDKILVYRKSRGANRELVVITKSTSNNHDHSELSNILGDGSNHVSDDELIRVSQVGFGSYTGAGLVINTDETAIVVSDVAMPANRLKAGTVIKITLIGSNTTTGANTSTFSVRHGTTGTVADGLIQQFVTAVSGSTATNLALGVTMTMTILTDGGVATSIGHITIQGGASGIGSNSNAQMTSTAIDTTTPDTYFTVSYQSAGATTTATFKQALIEILYK